MLYVGIAILFCIVLKHLLLVDDTVTVPYHFIITRKSFVEGSNLCPRRTTVLGMVQTLVNTNHRKRESCVTRNS